MEQSIPGKSQNILRRFVQALDRRIPLPVKNALRFSLTPLFLFVALLATALAPGLSWILLALVVVFMTFGDELAGDSRKDTAIAPVGLLNFFLYVSLPLMAVLTLLVATFLSDGDPFGLIGLASYIGIDLAAVRAETGAVGLGVTMLLLGLFYGSAGINVAHNLFHRTQSPLDVATGRWLLAFSCDTTFAIEHVYGHHKNVGTVDDPATARRGESLYAFWVRSTVGQVINAFKFEAARLKRRGLPALHWQNRALRGQFMSLAIMAVFFYAAGWTGIAAFLYMALTGKLFLESVNYIEHYGLVRAPGAKVENRHSWDSDRLISNAVLYNLPRHAAHHRNAKLEYWELAPSRGSAPILPMGYLSMIFAAMAPALWRKLLHPRLKDWDAQMASDAEREIIRQRGWEIA